MLNIDLFSDISESEVLSLLKCLEIKTKKYKKGSFIIPFETKITSIGIVLEGNIEIIKEDINGGKLVLAKLGENDIFAETLVCASVEKSPVAVVAATSCEVLFLPFEKVVSTCSKTCPFHIKLVKNMLKVIAKKNLMLHSQIELLGKKSIREKLLAFLTSERDKQNSKIFAIEYNRNQLADFLCADRSAMCRELCRLRDEGVLRFNKNYFELL